MSTADEQTNLHPYVRVCRANPYALFQYVKEINKRFDVHAIFRFDVTIAQNVQHIKPVQNCTGFIFCTFYALVDF